MQLFELCGCAWCVLKHWRRSGYSCPSSAFRNGLLRDPTRRIIGCSVPVGRTWTYGVMTARHRIHISDSFERELSPKHSSIPRRTLLLLTRKDILNAFSFANMQHGHPQGTNNCIKVLLASLHFIGRVARAHFCWSVMTSFMVQSSFKGNKMTFIPSVRVNRFLQNILKRKLVPYF